MANIFRQPCDEGVIRSRPIKVPCAAGAEPWILAATILGSSMVPANRAGVASGVNNAVSRIGGLFGIAVLGIIMVHSFNGELDRRLAREEMAPEVRGAIDEQRVRLAGADLPVTIDERTRAALKQTIDESFVFGFRLVMLTSAGLALASALVACRVIENR